MLGRARSLGFFLVLLLSLLAAAPLQAALSITRSDLIGSWYDYQTGSYLFFTLNGDGTGLYQDREMLWSYANETITIQVPSTSAFYEISIHACRRARMVISYELSTGTEYRLLSVDNSAGAQANFTVTDLVGSFEYTSPSGTKYTYTFYSDGYGVERAGTGASATGTYFTWTYQNPTLTLTGEGLHLTKSASLEPNSLGSQYTYQVIIFADDFLTLTESDGDILILKQK